VNRAVVQVMRGEVATGRAVMVEQSRLLQAQGAQTAHVLLSLADLDLARGDATSAWAWCQQTLAEVGPSLGEGGALTVEAWLAAAQISCALGRYEQALQWLAELDADRTARIHLEYRAQSLIVRATVERERGEHPAAEHTARSALRLARDVGDRRSEVAALLVLGDVARLTARPAQAVSTLDRALYRAEGSGMQYLIAQSLASLALARLDAGDRLGARSAAERAERIAADSGYRPVLERARQVLAEDRHAG